MSREWLRRKLLLACLWRVPAAFAGAAQAPACSVPVPADLTGDRLVNSADGQSSAQCADGAMVPCRPGCCTADLDRDGDVDADDFGLVQRCMSAGPPDPACCACSPGTSGCLPFDNGVWVIRRADPMREARIPEAPMLVILDGRIQLRAKIIEIYHRTESGTAWPIIVVFQSSGFVRVRPGEDSPPENPDGATLAASAVLGPAVWRDDDILFFNPQIEVVEIDTSALSPAGTLRIHACGHIKSAALPGPLNVEYDIDIPDPTDAKTTLHVRQTATVTAPFSLLASRVASHEAHRVVQASTMWIDAITHDSDAARYVNSEMSVVTALFTTQGALIFDNPLPMGERFLDVLHTDDEGFNGNSPNIRILLPADQNPGTFTPQGYIRSSTDVNNDNAGAWMHDDSSPTIFTTGQQLTASYTIEATDDPQ